MSAKPYWLQFVILLPAFDFLQWSVHNTLHRIPFLWRFHKVHHSVVDMDWIGNWRFHWGEIVVYRAAMYIPTAILGFAPAVLFYYGILNTIVGHYAHANLRLSLGPLKYVLNTPQMHIWHHNHPDSGPIDKNFAITLSIWDWLLGTAHMPAAPPAKLGFEGIESYPKNIAGQWLQPFLK
jgi:sterol desaturase/sphingolipid hydroxylase (fatty acid hydroxylase superfamily)